MNKRRALWMAAFGLATLVGVLVTSPSQAKIDPYVWKLSARQTCIAPAVCGLCCENGPGGACYQEQCMSAGLIGTASTPILPD